MALMSPVKRIDRPRSQHVEPGGGFRCKRHGQGRAVHDHGAPRADATGRGQRVDTGADVSRAVVLAAMSPRRPRAPTVSRAVERSASRAAAAAVLTRRGGGAPAVTSIRCDLLAAAHRRSRERNEALHCYKTSRTTTRASSLRCSRDAFDEPPCLARASALAHALLLEAQDGRQQIAQHAREPVLISPSPPCRATASRSLSSISISVRSSEIRA